MKIYKSKIDWWLGLPLVYPIFRSLQAILEGDWLGYFGVLIIVALLLFVSKTTRYVISENQLTVKCMWIVNDRIDIDKIRKIEKTNSILSSPALSLDRIAVKFNKYDEIYISPKEKQAFLDSLLQINPQIDVAV